MLDKPLAHEYLGPQFRRALFVQDYISNRLKPTSESDLSAMDSMCEPLEYSNYVSTLLRFSASTLNDVPRLLGFSDDHPEYLTELNLSSFSVFRQSLECSALAVWLMLPLNKKARIRRYIQAGRDENRRRVDFARSMGVDVRDEVDQKEVTLRAIERKFSLESLGKNQKLPQISQIFRSLTFLDHDSTWLKSWNLCSGMIHGSQWALIEVVRNDEVMDGLFHTYLNYPAVWKILETTVSLLDLASTKYCHLAGTLDFALSDNDGASMLISDRASTSF
ncbi:hypothetical protein [Arthrobacter sp. RCC_34]|uniref:hypothetical protein n=1 Tax=Arthrobacter sp. RCC_34 TaxID=3239230 RepID=UPI003524F863